MAETPKKAIAQGKRGGYYLVGSDRMVGGKLKRVYVNPDKYLASSGAATTEAPPKEGADPVAAKPDTKGGKAERPEKTASGKGSAPAIDEVTGFRIAGKPPKERDSRLPPANTEMKPKSKDAPKITVKEDDRGIFTVYGEDGKPAATGYSATAALSSFFGKPVAGISYLGLRKKPAPKTPKDEDGTGDGTQKPAAPKGDDTQEPGDAKPPKKQREKKPKTPGDDSGTPKPKKPRKESGELNRQEFTLMKMRQKVKNWARFDTQQALGHDARNIQTIKGTIGNKQYLVKQDSKVRIWAKEKGAKNKPFIVTSSWLNSKGRVPADKGARQVKATKEPVTVTQTRKLKPPESLKKALALLEYTDADTSPMLDIHSDGIVIRNIIGRVSGFVPFDEPLTGIDDDMTKAIPDNMTNSIRFELSAVERSSLDDELWQPNGEQGFIRSDAIHCLQSENCMVKAFCYDRSRMDFIGFASVQELCKALGIND